MNNPVKCFLRVWSVVMHFLLYFILHLCWIKSHTYISPDRLLTCFHFSPRSDEPSMLPLLKAGFDRVRVLSFILKIVNCVLKYRFAVMETVSAPLLYKLEWLTLSPVRVLTKGQKSRGNDHPLRQLLTVKLFLLSLKEMYREQYGVYVIWYWGVKGKREFSVHLCICHSRNIISPKKKSWQKLTFPFSGLLKMLMLGLVIMSCWCWNMEKFSQCLNWGQQAVFLVQSSTPLML